VNLGTITGMPPAFRTAVLLALLTLLSLPCLAVAQGVNELPKELDGVEIVEQPNAQVPAGAKFLDENGNVVYLSNYFNRDKPILLNLVYFRCPMLCTLVVNGMVDALRDVKYSPGQDFTILTISFDPLETYGLAALKRQNYLDLYGRAGAGEGWHFLTGTEKQIQSVTEAVGFNFKWNPAQQAYAHSSGIFVLTPDGRVSRTLYGVDFDPLTLRGSILEAGHGVVGTPLDKVYFSCLHFDAAAGRYTASVLALTRIVTGAILLFLGLMLVNFFRMEAAQRRKLVLADGPSMSELAGAEACPTGNAAAEEQA
jgi:protein SCO1/2